MVKLYEIEFKDFYITSIREGNHMPASCHYEGDAIDFQRQGISLECIRVNLSKDFDVVEYTAKDIFHVEYDPK